MSENLIMAGWTNHEKALKMAKNPTCSKFKIFKLFGSFVAIRPFEGDDNTIIVSFFGKPDEEGTFFLENLFENFIMFLFFVQRNKINFLADIGIEKNENSKIIFPISESITYFFKNKENISRFNEVLGETGLKLNSDRFMCIEKETNNEYYISEKSGDDYIINRFLSSDIKEMSLEKPQEDTENHDFEAKISDAIRVILDK